MRLEEEVSDNSYINPWLGVGNLWPALERLLTSFGCLLVITLMLLGVSSVLAASSSELVGSTAFQKVSPCPFEAAAGVPPTRLTCGFLSVPENRQKTNSATLKIPVAVIHTTHKNPKPDPLVFLAGGPGAAPTASPHTFQLFASHAFGVQRDIIVYTQRGGLMTEPALRCDSLRDARRTIYAKDQSLKQRDTEIAQLARDCLISLQSSGRDLSGYSARENAQDLKELRRALGLSQWNLMAVSYGTLIATEAARADPAGIRSLILDSVVSLESDLFMTEANRNFSYGLERVLNACMVDASCNAQFPAIHESLQSVINMLENTPITISLSGPDGSPPIKMVVNWHDFLGLVHWMLYNSKTLGLIPLLVTETSNSKLTLLTELMDRVFPAPSNTTDSAAGAFFATVCRDQFWGRVQLANTNQSYGGFAITSFMQQVCSDPALGYKTNSAPTLLQSNTPTLLLSGWFDPMTPDIYAEQTAAHFNNSTLVSIRNFGHSTLSGYTTCQTELAVAFLDDLKDKSDYPCLPGIEPPGFTLSLEEANSLFSKPVP